MDIAKIRKKIKQAEDEAQKSVANSHAAEARENRAATSDEKEPKPALIQETVLPPELEDEPKYDVKQDAGAVVTEEIKAGQKRPEIRGDDKTDEVIEILSFSLLKQEFALRISQLDEILKHQRITKVPKMPDYVLGITSLRGKIIPVIDLRVRLSLLDRPSEIDKKGKILIIKGLRGPIGAVVDNVIGVVRITKPEILPPPSHLTETELKLIEGVAIVDKRFISIINLDEIATVSF